MGSLAIISISGYEFNFKKERLVNYCKKLKKKKTIETLACFCVILSYSYSISKEIFNVFIVFIYIYWIDKEVFFYFISIISLPKDVMIKIWSNESIKNVEF